jgi:hypothetical protein
VTDRCPTCGATECPSRPYGGRFVRENLEHSLPAFCEECGWRGGKPKPVGGEPRSLRVVGLLLNLGVWLIAAAVVVAVGWMGWVVFAALGIAP